MTKKNFLLLGGWTSNEASYKHLVSKIPENITVYILPHRFFNLENPQEINKKILDFLE